MKEVIALHSGKINLDVGCGKGVYFPYYTGNVIGCDINLGLLKEAKLKRKSNSKLICANGLNLPFKHETFDLVLSSQVIEHLKEADHEAFVEELTRVSRDVILITTPNASGLLEFLRRVLEKLFGFYKEENICEDEELHHHSRLTVSKLNKMGFKSRGCLGFVTRSELENVGLGMLGKIYDKISWYFPRLGGTLLGFKFKKKQETK
jgi:ubiquinone/menaquinone biosynthesis C-methylase UbiE